MFWCAVFLGRVFPGPFFWEILRRPEGGGERIRKGWRAIAVTKNEDEPRVNEQIRVPEVLLIDDQGVKLGVVPTRQALFLAEERELDLVEVAPLATPPVCRIMDFGKFRFQQQKKDKDARKKQKTQTIKEMKMRPKIDVHDYNFKTRAIKDFLEDGHRVKVSVFFRGREMAFLDQGRVVLDRVAKDCEGLATIEMTPRMEGRFMRMMLAPVPQPKKASAPAAPKEPKEPKKDKASPTEAPDRGVVEDKA